MEMRLARIGGAVKLHCAIVREPFSGAPCADLHQPVRRSTLA